MKTKLLLTAMILILTTSNALAGKNPRLKRQSFSYETLKLPMQALPTDRSYTLYFDAAPPFAQVASSLPDRIQIPGWTKNFEQGEYAVEVLYDRLWFDNPRMIVRKKFKKDSLDRIIDTVRFFRNEYTARAGGRMRVLNAAGQEVLNIQFPEQCEVFTGREVRHKKALRMQERRESHDAHANMVAQFATNLLGLTNSALDREFGIYRKQVRDDLLIVRNKKHREYRDMLRLFQDFNMISDRVNLDADLNAIALELAPAIRYLNEVAERYDGSRKDDRQMRHIAYYNLAKIHMMLEQPEESLRYAQYMRNNDYKRSLAKTMVRSSQERSRLNRLHGM